MCTACDHSDVRDVAHAHEVAAPAPARPPLNLVADVLRSPGQPLDRSTNAEMTRRLGHDFSRVRVHADGPAGGSAAAVQASAYAVGEHVVLGAGVEPASPEGRRLLAHELAHVVQSDRSASSPGELHLAAPGGALEAEAAAAGQGTGLQAIAQVAPPGLVQRQVLPVARFSPAPGIVVDRTDRSVSIAGAMELYGPEADAARAASVQNAINTTWTHTFPDGYSVTCNVTVTYRGPGSSAGSATQIEAARTAGPSHVSGSAGSRAMTLNANESDAFTWTPAHEFGHIVGLDDRYSESIMSSLRGLVGGRRESTVQPGYEGNLMAETSGTLESKNVRDLAVENEPSPYWINDDDQVRDWVTAHSLTDVGGLSTANKLRAIHTLMGGWISDADVDAIVAICRSVTTRTEADAIRAGVDLLTMTSIGQRTTVRIAFAQMP